MPRTDILECRDGVLLTLDIQRRPWEHDAGGCPDMRHAGRLESSYSPTRLSVDDVWTSDVQVNGWRRAKKYALLDGHYDDLAHLAARRRTLGAVLGKCRPSRASGLGREPQNSGDSLRIRVMAPEVICGLRKTWARSKLPGMADRRSPLRCVLRWRLHPGPAKWPGRSRSPARLPSVRRRSPATLRSS